MGSTVVLLSTLRCHWVYSPVDPLTFQVVSCLILIAKHRRGGVHMRASWIFSANDVIANVGVIISGGLVMYFGSRFPGLIVGALISAIVLRGGFHILREVKESRKGEIGA